MRGDGGIRGNKVRMDKARVIRGRMGEGSDEAFRGSARKFMICHGRKP